LYGTWQICEPYTYTFLKSFPIWSDVKFDLLTIVVKKRWSAKDCNKKIQNFSHWHPMPVTIELPCVWLQYTQHKIQQRLVFYINESTVSPLGGCCINISSYCTNVNKRQSCYAKYISCPHKSGWKIIQRRHLYKVQSESRIVNNLDRIFLKSITILYVWLQSIKYPICFHIYEASIWECRCLYCCLLEKNDLDVYCYIEVCSEKAYHYFNLMSNVMKVTAVIIENVSD